MGTDGVHLAGMAFWFRHFRATSARAKEKPIHGSCAFTRQGDDLFNDAIGRKADGPFLGRQNDLSVEQFGFQLLVNYVNQANAQAGTH